MSERETPDFMTVESFSQLPFIRPTPPSRDKNSSAIRLFGIDVPHEPDGATEEEQPSSKANASKASGNDNGGTTGAGAGSGGGGGSSRKFECHYCCRNFPTSQALGGHQNAHKRERQHAKRAHLQSAMAATAHHHHQFLGGLAEGPVYGLVNYHRLGALASAARFAIGHSAESPLLSHYPPWNGTGLGGSLVGARLYGASGSTVSQPLNGSLFPGVWRMPAVQGGGGVPLAAPRDRPSTVLPLLGGHESRDTASVSGVVAGSGNCRLPPSSSSSAPPGSHLVYETAAGTKDHLSLDLHL